MRPPAYRMGLEVLLANAPAGAKIPPENARILTLDRQRWRTGKALAREQRRRDARMRAPARSILHHRRIRAHAQDLTARSPILGDPQRLPQLRFGEWKEAAAERCARQRVPGAGAVAIGSAG